MQIEAPADWRVVRMASLVSPVDYRTTESPRTPLYSLTIENGVTPKSERYDRSFLVKSDNKKYKLVRPGDLVFNPANLRWGAIAVSKVDHDVLLSPIYEVFRVGERTTIGYVEALSRSSFMMRAYNRVAEGTLVERTAVKTADFMRLPVPLPPLPEQKRIAAILSSVDEAIQAKRAVIEQTRRVKEGLLQDLLTRGIHREALVAGPYGTQPTSWQKVMAAEVCALITKGTTPPKGTMQRSGDIPYLRVGNLTFDGRLNLGDLLFVDRGIHAGVLSRSIIQEGDVLTNIVGPPLGQVALVDDRFREWNMNQAIAVLRADPTKLQPQFLAYFLQWRGAKRWLLARAKQTSGQVNLTLKLCRDLPLPLPNLTEQKGIVERLEAADAAIQHSIHTHQQQTAVKAGLLQDLLTGKVRVKP